MPAPDQRIDGAPAAEQSQGPHRVPVDLLLLYTREGSSGVELLVGLRQGGYAPGVWDTPSVH